MEFRTEALELLEIAEKSLLEIDSGAPFATTYDSVFRGFHNLKGGAAMMELQELKSHTHELENILTSFKESASIPKEYVSLFLRGIDAARSLLAGESISFDYRVENEPPLSPEASSAPTETAPPTAEAPVLPLESSAVQNIPSLPDATLVAESTASSATEAAADSVAYEFFSECEETIERITGGLQQIEARTHNRETIDSLYRDFHSLKGTAYLFSYTHLGDVAHIVETSLEPIRDGSRLPSQLLVDGIFNALKMIDLEVQCLKKGTHHEKMAQLLPALSRAFAGIARKLEAPPTLAAVAPAGPQPQIEDPLMDKLEDLSAMAEAPSEASVTTEAPALSTEAPTPPPASVSAVPNPAAKEVVKDAPKEAESASIRVPVALLDNLMTLMGEMVLVRNQVLQFSNNSEDLEFLNLSKRLNVVTSEIQGEMMKTRMQPIGNILNKFQRVVRDLSHELGKSISLHLNGADTELDKSLLEAIKDPLTHIVRNACDHGIETPQIRRQSNKADGGNLSLHAFHEGGQVVIEISDDGKGLHKEVLLKKGLEKGLINESQAKQMTDKEIYNLIFAPGFSTAAKVTNVSGRGVGMDIVRTNIEKIGGTVDLASVPGRGTTIRIKIPLTLAIVPALIIHSASNIFAIPQVKLVELVRVDQGSEENRIEYLQGAPVYRLRGSILPLVDLNKVLRLNPERAGEDRIVNIAVLNTDHCSFGLIVDSIQDTADIVVKPLNRLLKSLQVYSGATILGDGSVALILDVMGLSKVANIGRELENNAKSESAEQAQAKIQLENQDYLLVKLRSPTKHAIVLNYVHRLEEFKRSAVEWSGDRRVIRYRDRILPLVSASEQLGYKGEAKPDLNESFPVIVVERAGTLFGIEVEEILDTLSTTLEVDTRLAGRPGIYGNINTAEELVVVVDPFDLISMAYPHFVSAARKPTVAPPVAGVPVAQEAARAFQGGLRILLAEDTTFFRRAIAKVLEGAGHSVTVAKDGQEALEIFRRDHDKLDLIVSDIEMPRLNGFHLARAVRAASARADIPMLAISSRADQNYVSEGQKAGFDVYLEKLKPDLLLGAVEELTRAKGKAA